MAVILEQDADARVGPQRIHIEYAFLFRDPKCRALFDQPIGIMADEYVGVTVFRAPDGEGSRSEENTSELQSLMRISYAVFCLIKKQTLIRSHCCNLSTNQ